MLVKLLIKFYFEKNSTKVDGCIIKVIDFDPRNCPAEIPWTFFWLLLTGLFLSFLLKITKICKMALDVWLSHHFVKKLLFQLYILMKPIKRSTYTSPILHTNGRKNNGLFIWCLNHKKSSEKCVIKEWAFAPTVLPEKWSQRCHFFLNFS